MSPVFPLELFSEIFPHLRKDRTTLSAVREASMTFALLSQQHAFSDLVFRDQEHIVDFFDLASLPGNTIPKFIRCESIHFRNAETIEDEKLPKIRDLMSRIEVNHSLAIHVTAGRIPQAVVQLSIVWKDNIRRLSISGTTHAPSTFFLIIASFPRLEALALRNFHTEEEVGVAVQYAFPPSVTQLSLSRCAPFWSFLRQRVLPGGGLTHVTDMYIQELFFGGEAGVVDMRECFRELNGIHTITLDPVYHATLNNFNCAAYDIYRRSWEATLLQMGGLTHLRINCANLPPKFAMEYVGMYALQFSACLVETVVEVYFPHARESWSSSAYEDFQEVLDAMRDPDPSTTGPTRSNLVVRGLPDVLPNGIKAARGVTVCRHPVVFKESDWEEVMGERLDGL